MRSDIEAQRQFVKTVKDNFSEFDLDGDNQLNKFELMAAEANSRLSQEARNAAVILSKNFNQAKELSGTSKDTAAGGVGDYKFNELFGRDTSANAITKRDLAVMELLVDPARFEGSIASLRKREIVWGITELGVGAAIGTVGIALGAASFLSPMGLAGKLWFGSMGFGAIGGAAGTLMYDGYNNLRHSGTAMLRQEFAQRQKMLSSWK